MAKNITSAVKTADVETSGANRQTGFGYRIQEFLSVETTVKTIVE